MNRSLAFVGALLLAFVAVSSACFAQPAEMLRFTLESERGNPARIQTRFDDDSRGRNESSWSTGFMPSDLVGMEVSSFRAAGTRPLHFAIIREAGRLDCAGQGGNSHAAGHCRFTPDAGFSQFLAGRGIGRPTRRQAFGMVAVGVRRALIDGLAQAHYPTPSIDDLTALSALGADARYIADMARAGYRPRTLQSLIEFKALDITPQWIAGFAGVGYANVPGDGLVQLRALHVTPDYIAGFQAIGYRNLPVDTLVQLKALDITPEFVRSAVGQRRPLPSADELVQIKLFGRRR